MPNKKVLRATYLEKRLFLSDQEYDTRNHLLFQEFKSAIDLTTIGHLHVFLPIPEKMEVNTWLMIHHIRQEFPEITLYTSRSMNGGELEHFILREDTRLLVNKWGIPEPAEAEPLVPKVLDLILVPLIVFDKEGHRIGYGKGYYDRFLKKYPNARKVGVSLSPPLDRIDFTDKNDMALDLCLTPFKSYLFG